MADRQMSHAPARMPRRRATLKDVARAVGVHVSTVSRALNPKTSHLITSEVRDRIRLVCAELDYVPNRTATSLRTRRTMTIGVIIPDITNLIFPPMIRGIEDGLAEHGYVAIVANTDGDPRREKKMAETLIARSVDGLIMANVQRRDLVVADLAAHGFEVVTMNRRVDDPAIPSVVNDDEAGIRAGLDHLLGLGHRRIAHLGGPQSVSTGRDRHVAFGAAARAAGLREADCPRVFADALSEAEGRRCAELLIDGDAPFTALLTANDLLAIGAIAALGERGFACPGDVSVTGFNDMPFAARLSPPLTTVRIDLYGIGRTAARILAARLAAPLSPLVRHEVMPTRLIVRGSTAPPQQGG